MKTIRIFSLTLAIFCVLFYSCKHDPELVPSAKVVCFDNQILPIIIASCAKSGCHDGNGGEAFALLNYYDIRGQVEPGKPLQSPLYKVITANPHFWSIMPPKPEKPLNSAQIDYIEIWILQEAMNTTAENYAGCNLNCDTTNVTFSRTIKPIHDLYCASCHSGSTPSAGILLIDYASITSAMSKDVYFKSIKHETGTVPMPQGGAKLDDCTIAEIQKWFSAGMPNN